LQQRPDSHDRHEVGRHGDERADGRDAHCHQRRRADDQDMTKGPRTFKLPALKSGSYKWSCGMNMQHGVLKVQ
jgi:hypothetical protein